MTILIRPFRGRAERKASTHLAQWRCGLHDKFVKTSICVACTAQQTSAVVDDERIRGARGDK